MKDNTFMVIEQAYALLDQHAAEDFVIDMTTFGTFRSGVCFGCAATCTIQQIAGIELDDEHVSTLDDRVEQLSLDYEETDRFESAINLARYGDIKDLLKFYDALDAWLNAGHQTEWDFVLQTEDWREQLDTVRQGILYLKERGF